MSETGKLAGRLVVVLVVVAARGDDDLASSGPDS